MKVKHYTDVQAARMEDIPGITIRWVIGEQDGAPYFAMRVFEIEPGHATPFHPHWNEHEVFVLAGQGALRTESGETPLLPGSVAFVPGNEMHQFINHGDDVFRFICVVPHDWLQGMTRNEGDNL